MKKGLQLSAAAVLALSAITPVAAAAAENTEIAQGVYTVDGFTSLENFTKLKSADKGNLLMSPGAVLVIGTDAIPAELIIMGSDADIEAGTVNAEQYQIDNNVTFDQDKGIVSNDPSEAELTVESVKAINPTTVKVSFNNELTEVAKENVAIEGVTVSEVTLADNKKDVFVTVTPGFEFDKEYTVTVSDLTETPLTTTFTSLAVTDIWNLQIDAPERLEADGVDTGVITFKLVDKETGEVDVKANDVVLDVNSTYGYLSQKRVTMQNGEATVILRSEFQEGGVTAKIEAQVIEAKAGSIYKELVGKLVAQPVDVKFGIGDTGPGQGEVVLKSLKAANTNEADRVVLTFDHEIEAKELYNVDTGVLVPGAVKVEQEVSGTKYEREVVGYAINPTNKKSVTVYLGKGPVNDTTDQEFLVDNTDVYVTAKIGLASAQTVSFKFADARTPNLASVKPITLANGTTSNKQLTVAFTEPVLEADFVIDGRFDETDFSAVHGDVTWDNTAKKFVDKRNEVTITLESTYQEPDKAANGVDHIYPAGFFKPGTHELEASSIIDFAAHTDTNNIGTTQNLSFTIDVNDSLVQPEVIVDSPEQFRVDFNMDYSILDDQGVASAFEDEVQLQVFDAASGDWVAVDDTYFTDAVSPEVDFADFLEITPLGNTGNYKIETKADWTYVYDTAKTKNNYYNDEFRLVLPKGQVVTAANGKKNAEDIVLELTKAPNSPLATPDTKSPEIVEGSIKKVVDFNALTKPEFDVALTEPVKILTGDEAGITLAQGQTDLPEPKVEFIGKDKDGKTRTFIGTVVDYKDAINKDIIVKWNTTDVAGNPIETPQDIVNDGGLTEWTLVIKSISDDVGNTAATVTNTFELEPTTVVAPSDVFRVAPNTGDAIGDGKSGDAFFGVTGLEGDSIEITFTEAVATTGLGSATNVKNYALNGKDLPAGSSIALAKDAAGNAIDHKVVIKLTAGTLNPTNVITLTKNLKSAKGVDISEDLSFTFDVITTLAVVSAANDALAAHTTAGGSATDAEYLAVEAALAANPQVTADIVAATNALTAATAALTAGSLATAISDANAALTAHTTAGGSATDAEYLAVEAALAASPQVVADIIAATTTLEAVTEVLVADALLAAADLTSLLFTEDGTQNVAANVGILQGLVDALGLDAAITAVASEDNGNYVVTLSTANATQPRVDVIAQVTTVTP